MFDKTMLDKTMFAKTKTMVDKYIFAQILFLDDQFDPFLDQFNPFHPIGTSLFQFGQNQNIMIHRGSNNWTPCSFDFWIRRLDLLPNEFSGLILTHFLQSNS